MVNMKHITRYKELSEGEREQLQFQADAAYAVLKRAANSPNEFERRHSGEEAVVLYLELAEGLQDKMRVMTPIQASRDKLPPCLDRLAAEYAIGVGASVVLARGTYTKEEDTTTHDLIGMITAPDVPLMRIAHTSKDNTKAGRIDHVVKALEYNRSRQYEAPSESMLTIRPIIRN